MKAYAITVKDKANEFEALDALVEEFNRWTKISGKDACLVLEPRIRVVDYYTSVKLIFFVQE